MPRNDVCGSVSQTFLEEPSFEFCCMGMVNTGGYKELTAPMLCKSGLLAWVTAAVSKSQQNYHQKSEIKDFVVMAGAHRQIVSCLKGCEIDVKCFLKQDF